MDLLQLLIPIMAAIFKEAPRFIEDGQKLADALRSHPDPAVRPGAAHVDAALNGASSVG